MSDCRICDTCGHVFSVLDEDARRINMEVPTKEGNRTTIEVIQRDACGACSKRFAGRPVEQQQAITATVADA
jgi:hypothetical protein